MSLLLLRPAALLLLVFPILLLLREWAWRRDRVAMPFDHQDLPRQRWLPFGLKMSASLPAGLLAVAVLLAAGPQRLGDPRQVRQLTNIEICLDVSGSMGWPLAGGANRVRYQAAMEAISAFTERRKGDACGLTIFGGEHIRWTPLTKDLDAIRLATPFLDPTRQPPHMRSTRIGAALRAALATLTQVPEGDRMIVLVSDGESQDLGGGEAGRVGRSLRDADVALYAIHIGDGDAPAQLHEVVGPTGGAVFAAHDHAGLEEIFAHIDRMQPARLRPASPSPVDWYRPLVFIAACLLGIWLLCALLGWRWTP